MKRIRIYLLMFLTLAGFSCADQLEINPYQSLSVEESISDYTGLVTALNGAYDGLQSVNYYGRNFIVVNEVRADNVYIAIANSNRFLVDYRFEYAPLTGQTALWNQGYSIILRVNNIINNINNVSGIQANKDQVLGEALTLRALVHFDMVRMFALPYAEGTSNPGIPIMLQAAIGTPARNTVGEVYAQVVDDLTDALPLLTQNVGKYRITANAARALLARVYLHMGQFQNAIDQASAVIGAGYTLYDGDQLPTFWGSSGTSEEIWTIRRRADETMGSDNLGQIFNPQGYGDIRVTEDIIDSYEVGDTRLSTIYTHTDGTSRVGKYLAQEGVPGLVNVKVLRLAEMYLIRAEAYARLGGGTNLINAANDLNVIRNRAGLDDFGALDGATALTEILAEKNREFAFEGHRFLDLIRVGRAVTRIQCGSNPSDFLVAPCLLADDSPLRIYPIPQREMDVNPNMVQNEGYN